MSDLPGWDEVARWRKVERIRLIDARMAMSQEARKLGSDRIAARAAGAIRQSTGDITGRVVSFYWPFRGEPDLRALMSDIMAGGGLVALPVVVAKGQPLAFRLWSPGEPLEKGVWDIPIPSQGAATFPDVVIAPVVGVDAAQYRLGYGGGFFDRTLAAAPRKPMVIGVGYQASRIDTIHPQPHDIAMDLIVTDA